MGGAGLANRTVAAPAVTVKRMAGQSVAPGAVRPGRRLPVRREALLGLAVFGVAFLVYQRTLTPGLSYSSPDGNELIVVSQQLGLAHPTGYPLYTWLGKLFTFLPVGDFAYRVNLMSAVMAAGGAALVYAIARLLGMSALAAAFTGLLFAFGRTLWSQAVIAEVYAPNAFMVALTLYWLLRWEGATVAGAAQGGRARRYLFAFALTYGLSLGTHLSNLGFAPAYLVFLLLARGWRCGRELGLVLLGFLLGAAQFLWVPLRGADQLRGIPGPVPLVALAFTYKYTLGAFGELRFAFPLAALPDRIVLYLELLRLNVTGLGIVLGVVGMWALLFSATRRFYLLALMYTVHLFFFLQYRAFDLDVFFIPSHLVFTLFVGYGLQQTVSAAASAVGLAGSGARALLALGGRRSLAVLRTEETGAVGCVGATVADGLSAPAAVARVTGRLAYLPPALLALLLFLLPAGQWKANFAANDRSRETAIGDFYRHVYAQLPPQAVVWTAGAVFGYDMFYYHLAYGARPDVSLPMLERQAGRQPPRAQPGENVFSTVRPGQMGQFQPPLPSLDEAWYVPTIAAPVAKSGLLGRRELVLYHISDTPPALVVAEGRFPGGGPIQKLDGIDLVGYQVEPRKVKAGGVIDITYYWRLARAQPTAVLTRLARDDSWLEVHELGFGNVGRYLREHRLGTGVVVREEYQLVVPSGTPKGIHMLQVGVLAGAVPPAGVFETAAYLDLGKLEVR